MKALILFYCSFLSLKLQNTPDARIRSTEAAFHGENRCYETYAFISFPSSSPSFQFFQADGIWSLTSLQKDRHSRLNTQVDRIGRLLHWKPPITRSQDRLWQCR